MGKARVILEGKVLELRALPGTPKHAPNSFIQPNDSLPRDASVARAIAAVASKRSSAVVRATKKSSNRKTGAMQPVSSSSPEGYVAASSSGARQFLIILPPWIIVRVHRSEVRATNDKNPQRSFKC